MQVIDNTVLISPYYTIHEGDQKTDEWFRLRDGCIITGSNAKKVKGTGTAYLYELLAKATTEREPEAEIHTKHIDRGVELEPVARKEYEKVTKTKVREVSFIQNGRIGISPDGLVMKKEKVVKLLEIKCPDTPNHIRYILENKVPSEHEDQIIHGFVTCPDVDEIDFISYDPKFLFKPLHILTVKRNVYMVDITTTRIQYEKFINKFDEKHSQIKDLILN